MIRLNENVKEGNVINAKQKIGEIEILNIKNPIVIDFKYRVINIFVKNNEKVDYGKNIILGEKIENGNN